MDRCRVDTDQNIAELDQCRQVRQAFRMSESVYELTRFGLRQDLGHRLLIVRSAGQDDVDVGDLRQTVDQATPIVRAPSLYYSFLNSKPARPGMNKDRC